MERSPSAPGPAIEIAGLSKRFGETQALDGLDLRVPHGSIFGLLGPNGAGKTTLVRILATLLRPDRGTARVLGHDVGEEADAVRAGIALTGQFASVDQDLSGRENLVLLARLLGLRRRDARRRAAELLDAFDLGAAADRQARSYSGGMRRRLDIAASLILTPRLLFLDEPTTGLDPRSRGRVWDMVRELAGLGTTVLLTTQYLEEADRLSDRVAVIDEGRLLAAGRPAELRASVGAMALRVRLRREEQAAAAAALLRDRLGSGRPAAGDAAVLTAPAADPDRALRALAALADAGVEVADFSLSPPSLDEVFLTLTGRAAAAPDQAPDPIREAA